MNQTDNYDTAWKGQRVLPRHRREVEGSRDSQTIDENWVEPTSLAEAIEWRDEVLTELQDIQDQLGEPKRLIEAHSMTDEDYRVWQGRAKVALKYKLATYRRLKARIQTNRGWATTPLHARRSLTQWRLLNG